MKLSKPIPTITKPEQEASVNNIIVAKKWLNKHYELRYNVVLSRKEYKPKDSTQFMPLDERLINSWYTQFKEKRYHLSRPDWQRLLDSEFISKFDPFVEYFNSLPEWDEKDDHILELSKTVQTNNPVLWRKHLKMWLVGTVANAINRGNNHLGLILSGTQGEGKTTWLNKLVPVHLCDYTYCGSIDPGNKDSKVLLAECLLINLDELEVTTRKEMATLKSIMTLDKIRERKAYRADAETLPRRASFVGSVNDPAFLTDPTGSRRFLCHNAISIEMNHNVDINKVYSQAFSLLKSGFRYYLDKEDQAELELSNTDFRVVSFEQEIISRYYVPGVIRTENSIYMNATSLIKDLIEKGETLNCEGRTLRAFGAALKAMKFERVKKSDNYVYVLTPKQVFEKSLEAKEPDMDIAC